MLIKLSGFFHGKKDAAIDTKPSSLRGQTSKLFYGILDDVPGLGNCACARMIARHRRRARRGLVACEHRLCYATTPRET
jgi:hypothetical protein